jgi:hypothetical protein
VFTIGSRDEVPEKRELVIREQQQNNDDNKRQLLQQ